MNKKVFLLSLSKAYTITGISALVLGFALIMVPTVPYIWYVANPSATNQEIERIYEDIKPEEKELEIITQERELPPINPDLPKDPYVIIEKIGVESPISDGENYIKILMNGTWMVPEFGDPIESNLSIILAAHRFGYSNWSREERNKVSYFNLPKTTIGDEIKIVWQQREFIYEIYKEEESTYISDYDADLILYTCKYFNSPIRIFRYAKAIY